MTTTTISTTTMVKERCTRIGDYDEPLKPRRRQNALRRARKKASKGVPIDAGRNYAEFEQHSNAIGSKLMEKMGFTHGTGLGAKRDGKAEPVEAVMRKKRAGLGT